MTHETRIDLTPRHVDPFIVNGRTRTHPIHGGEYWRIDDLSEGRVGMDLLNNPAALIRGPIEFAEAIAAAMNKFRQDVEAMGPGTVRDPWRGGGQ